MKVGDEMKIVTCASYYGTGSSAITDLLSEYDCCKSLYEYEFRFVQDPEGISDLEFNLVENHHRHNSGHALKRYRNKVDFLVDLHFNKGATSPNNNALAVSSLKSRNIRNLRSNAS